VVLVVWFSAIMNAEVLDQVLDDIMIMIKFVH
jgi:hypothetical protein